MRWTNSQLVVAGIGLGIGGGLIIRALDVQKPAAKVPPPVAVVQKAQKRVRFRLRPTETGAQVGPFMAAGTALDLLSATSLQKSGQTLWKVRTGDGTVGWTFIDPREIIRA